MINFTILPTVLHVATMGAFNIVPVPVLLTFPKVGGRTQYKTVPYWEYEMVAAAMQDYEHLVRTTL